MNSDTAKTHSAGRRRRKTWPRIILAALFAAPFGAWSAEGAEPVVVPMFVFKDAPISMVQARFEKETKRMLRVEGSLSNLKLTLMLRNKTAEQIVENIARQYDAAWRQHEDGAFELMTKREFENQVILPLLEATPKVEPLSYSDAPLAEVLDTLEALTGDRVRASAALAGQTVSIATQQASTAEVVDLLARDLGGIWWQTPEGVFELRSADDPPGKQASFSFRNAPLALIMKTITAQTRDQVTLTGAAAGARIDLSAEGLTTPEILEGLIAEYDWADSWTEDSPGKFTLDGPSADSGADQSPESGQGFVVPMFVFKDAPSPIVASRFEQETGKALRFFEMTNFAKITLMVKNLAPSEIIDMIANKDDGWYWRQAPDGAYELSYTPWFGRATLAFRDTPLELILHALAMQTGRTISISGPARLQPLTLAAKNQTIEEILHRLAEQSGGKWQATPGGGYEIIPTDQ